jgi:hypothetical protein
MKNSPTLRRLLMALTVLLLAALVLAACGGDDKKDNDQNVAPDSTPLTGDDDTPTPWPTEWPVPTATPYVPPEAPVYEAASEQAVVDLAANSDISLDELEVLPPDTVLLLDAPLDCPDLPEAAEDVAEDEIVEYPEVYYVYVQHQRFIYAYQVLPATDPDGQPVVQKCNDEFVDEDVLYIPETEVTSDPVEAVRADLEARAIDPEAGEFSISEMTWTDEALGCPEDAGIEEPVSASIDGYLVVYTVGRARYEYHTDLTGEQMVYCAPPPGFDTAEDFIAVMVAEQEDLEVDPIPADMEDGEGIARYEGLDAEGAVVEFTLQGIRVGVFDFDSEEAALDAAYQIDDTVVSHIFVSGRVLLVMEENSLQVFGMLQDYATEVRNVIAEEDQQALEEAAAEEAAEDADVGDDDDAEEDSEAAADESAE